MLSLMQSIHERKYCLVRIGDVMQNLKYGGGGANAPTVAINAAGCLLFAALFTSDQRAADTRIARRDEVRHDPPLIAHPMSIHASYLCKSAHCIVAMSAQHCGAHVSPHRRETHISGADKAGKGRP